jgi:MSHA biogenesis protein MshO
MMRTLHILRQDGVTLVELIVAITILAIIGGMVAIFMQRPIQGYVDASNRAELTNRADTALRRIARDVRLALPNSLRVSTVGSTQYLEFLITSGGGRYRAAIDTATPVAANVLDFGTADGTFEVLGPMPAIANGNLIVVYNLFSAAGTTTSNAYNGGAGTNRAAVTSVAGNIVNITATQFPFESPSARFQVVTGAVTYECNPTAQLVRRYSGYAITLAQPAPPAGTPALLVDGVSACGFTYDNAATSATLRTGVLSMTVQLTRNGENVSLQQQVHVDNVP